MEDSEQWLRRRGRLLETGIEVHRFFNIGRKVGDITTLDFFRNSTRQRLLSYPSSLADGLQPIHPDYMPFPLVRDGKLTHDGIDIREVPSGTVPLLRVAQSFDTPNSGALQRPEIFRKAGKYIGSLWHDSRSHLPKNLSLDMLSYTPEGDGIIACVPPSEYSHEPDPHEAFEAIGEQLQLGGFAPDLNELIEEFRSGIKEVINASEQ